MLTQIINGRILTPQGWLKDGSVLICDGKILEVTNSDLAVIGATVIDARGMTIVPGFVSMHAHGGGGHVCACCHTTYRKVFPKIQMRPMCFICKHLDSSGMSKFYDCPEV